MARKNETPESYLLKASSAFVLDGTVVRKGEKVEVTEKEAKNLLSRGKAEVVTAGKAQADDKGEQQAQQPKDAGKAK